MLAPFALFGCSLCIGVPEASARVSRMKETLLTVGEVAQRLRLHPTTVRRLCRTGALRAVRVGGQWRVYALGGGL